MNEQAQDFNNRPRRSCLYVPGINKKAIDKIKSIPIDAVIFDLEDAVAPDLKDEARSNISTVLTESDFRKCETIVRINALNTLWGRNDLAMINQIKPDGILVPKIKCAKDIEEIDRQLQDKIALWVMIETPLALLNIQEIASASQHTKLVGFIMGTNDLAKELHAVTTPDRLTFQYALSITIIAARAYGLVIIDGVYNDISNLNGLEQECQQGQLMGFDGKTLIHPNQIEICNQIFSPTIEDIEEARAIITAFQLPENQNKGVINVNGKMTELLHLDQAKRVIAIHEAIVN